MSETRARRVVVLSTHLDDAVLSLGAWIRRLSRAGVEVEIVTVLGDDPASNRAAGWWDRDGGFATEGDAAQARRAEDERACSLIGAKRTVFPYGDVTYGRGATDERIWADVRSRLVGADLVLIPGYPLLHADHQWLARLAMRGEIEATVGLYVEQPYVVLADLRLWRWRWRPRLGEALRGLTEEPSTWTVVRTSVPDRLAKWRATKAYRSQIRLLGRRPPVLWRMAIYETVRGGETIGWVTR